ncbi:MAG: signal peptidase II [Lachnospiraceae bacterium]|jgi:signal peptidase II|nr:signal peptidase II [Lachnospiraceae bacterium]
MKKTGMQYWVGALLAAVLVGIDQLTKQLAQKYLMDGPFVIWDGVFELHYSTNKGAAFGILQDRRLFFILSTCIILAAVLYFYSRIPLSRKYLPLRAVCVTIIAGALGNFIDRLRLEYVIDFLYFKLINFPVFNVADCYITISCVAFAILIFFWYKEEDLDLLWSSREKEDAKI